MILLFALFIEIFGDFIYPDHANPIVPYRNNENAYTFYDIFLSVSTRIATNGRLQITFPQEFDGTQLRLLKDDIMTVAQLDTDCYIEYTFSTTTTCIPYVEPPVTTPVTNYYTITNRTITIFFGSDPLNAGSQQVRIKYNKNPVGLGGKSSGYLQVITLRDTVPVDQNLNFGTVGFAPAYIAHSTASEGTIINDGSKLGGFTTNYVIQFTTTVDLKTGSWFRAEIADGFDISNVQCVLVDTQQDLKCTVDGRRVYFSAINAPLLKGQHKVKLKNVVNPSASGDSDPFIFETLEPLVNTVIEYFNVGVTNITPGQIINPSIAGAPLNQNLRIDYTIKFTPQNKIPYYGKIDYIVPTGFTLDPTCRIISGLSQNGTTPISCVTNGQNISITDFASFSPQEITLKIYAINPPSSALYQFCKIYTYSTFGKVPVISGLVDNFKGIDSNVQAGSIQISDIQSPYYVAIDLYKYMQNISLDGTGPIDFRLYPFKELKLATSPTSYGSIYFQIPLWWRMSNQNFDGWNVVGNTPTCNFGAEIAASCSYRLQIYSFKTSSTTNYVKYDPQTGLSFCDLPISVATARITPIPGRFDFRVLTFNDAMYSNWATPLEQDLYTMDIAVDQFVTGTTYVKCTSVDQVDADMVCYANVKVQLAIPYEGAINLNMSTVNSTYESSAAWPNDLGFGLGNDAKKRIPCYVNIRASHKQVQCWVFSGGTVRKYAILQVRGFSSKINTGTNVFIVIPNVKSCTAYDMQCYMTVSSAWTTELDEPYTLNYLKQSIGFIKMGDVYKDVTVNAPVLAKDQQDATLAATFSLTRQQICELTTWNFAFQHTEVLTNCGVGTSGYPYCSSQTPDHILIKFTDKTRFPDQFSVTATSPHGAVYLIDHFLTGEYYYFIIVNAANVAANGPVILQNIYNPIIYTPGIDTKIIYWNQNRKQKRITFPTSNIFVDGGILGPPSFDILPQTAVGMNADRSQTTDMDFDSWIIFRATFTTCHKIPANGMVELEVQTGLVDWAPNCQIWSGVTSAPKRLGFTHECNNVDVGGVKYYQVTKFYEIPVLTKFTLSFRAKTGLTATTAAIIRIRTYLDATVPTTTPSNVDNFYNTVYPPNLPLYGIDITGPKRFPIKLEWMDFIIINNKAREGTRGEFYMHITTNHNIQSYNSNPSPRLVFTFNTTGITMPAGGIPHCRIEGHLARYCDWSGGVITMAMPLLYGMNANTPYLVMISTRGADYSATYQEGLHHVRAGSYKLKVETQNTGTNQFIRKVMIIDPPKFSSFWVWSANKVGLDPITASATIQGMSVYRLYFVPSTYIPASDNADPISLIILFNRQIWPTFTNGFEQDLGTGFPHRTQLPCIQIGFSLLASATQLKCRLFYGSYPNPTKVIITDFDAINAGTSCEIHIPNIFNPNSTYELTQISIQAQKTDAITGISQLFLQSDYNLINGTFGRTKEQPGFNKLSIDVPSVVQADLQTVWPAAVNPTFSVTTIDTAATLSLQYGSKDYDMGGGADMILFEIPPNWGLPYGMITCTFPAGSVCYSYPLGPYIGLYPDSGITANSLQSGTVSIKTPPFKVLVATSDPPIKIFVFTRSKLVYIYKIDFTQVLSAVQVTPAATCAQCYYSNIEDYTITVTNPKNIPTTGAITITIPTGLTIRENGCRNDVQGGSTLSKSGFVCSYDGANSQLRITGFSNFIGPGKIVIKVKMENPVSPTSITAKWVFQTWYLDETPLNKLITYGDCSSPSLSTGTTTYYWDTPYRSRIRARTTLYGTLEFRINLYNDLLAGGILNIKFPALFDKIRCSQFLCLWDATPWYDNHNDDFLTSEKCLYDKTNRILQMYTPISVDIKKNTLYRVIIDTQNSVDGSRGFELPIMNSYVFDIYTTVELKHSSIFIPQLKDFAYFEAISLITNVKSKNMMIVRFNPNQNIPATSGTFAGGYLKLYFPTLSEESAYLYDDDLGTGKQDGDKIQCYARNGFPVAASLQCNLYLGNKVLGKHAYILIQGWSSALSKDPNFSANYTELFSKIISTPWSSTGKYYEFDIDQFYTPDLQGDDKHIEMRLESYTGSTLLDQSFSYDMTLKHYASATGTLASPTKSSNTLFDPSVTFDLTMNANVQLKNTEEYDYFIFEYSSPEFDPQPQNVQCESGSVLTCRVSQGNNWIVVKPSSTVSGVTALKFKNSNNPILAPTGGIVCKGYAVKDRIITAIYTYAAITSYVLPAIAASTYGAIVTPVDFTDNATIPISTEIKVRVEITIPTQSITLPYGSIIDVFLPANFVGYNFAISTTDTQAKFVTADNLKTSFIASSAVTGYTGRPQLTITGWEPIDPGNKIRFETYCKTSPSAVTGAAWDFKAWKDSGRTIQLWTSSAVAFNVQSYNSFKTLEWKIKDPTVARKNQASPFTFHISFKTAPTASTIITVTFPAASTVTVPAGANLQCTIETTAGTIHKFAYCYGANSLDIIMKMPISPTTFLAAVQYKVTISSRGNSMNHGLLFGASGIFTATLTQDNGDTGTLRFEILPTEQFASTQLRVVNSGITNGVATSTALLFSFTTSVTIPKTGKIVIVFPLLASDGTTVQFLDVLKSGATYNSGDLYPGCYSTNLLLYNNGLNCRIFKNSGEYLQTQIVIQSFTADITTTNPNVFQIVIEDVTLSQTAASANILLYTADINNNKLEAYVFEDAVNPYIMSQTSMSPAVSGTLQTAQAVTSFTFTNIQFALNTYSTIAYRFPPNYYDVSTAAFGGSTTCTSAISTVEVYAHWIIQKFSSPTNCANTQSVTLAFIKQVNAIVTNLSKLSFQVYSCLTRVCQHSQSSFSPLTVVNGAVGGTFDYSTQILDINQFPFSYTKFEVKYTCSGHDIPLNGQILLIYDPAQINVQRIELKSGGITSVTVSSSQTNSSSYNAIFNLLSPYLKSAVTISFDVYGILPQSLGTSGSAIFNITLQNRYDGVEISSDANKIYKQQNVSSTITGSQSFSTIPSTQELNFITLTPGTMNTDGDLYMQIPSFTSADGNQYSLLIFIDGLIQGSGACAVQFLETITSGTPICGVISTGKLSVSGIDSTLIQSQFFFQVYKIQVSKSGLLPVTVQLIDSGNNVKAVYIKTIIIYQNAMDSFGASFSHDTNGGGTNILEISFDPPPMSNFNGFDGELYLDLLGSFTNLPSSIIKEQCDYQSALNVDCEFVPQFRLSSVATSIPAHRDPISNRIVISKFEQQSTGANNIKFWFYYTYSSSTYSVKTKAFQFGYYTKGEGNNQIYKFGYNFILKLSDLDPAVLTTNSIVLNFNGQAQSIDNIATANINTQGIQFDSGDCIQIKLLAGYYEKANSFNNMKPLSSSATISTSYISSTMNSTSTNDRLGLYETCLTNSGTYFQISINNVEMPYKPQSSGVAAIALRLDPTSREIKEIFTFSKGTDTSTATFTTCSVKQIDSSSFEFQFTLPTNFKTFNHNGCVSDGTCYQYIEITAGASYSDAQQYEVTCGLGTSVINQYIPYNGYPMKFDAQTQGFRLSQYLELNSNAQICIKFKKKTAATAGATTFTLKIYDNQGASINIATCAAPSITVSNSASSTQLSGVVKTHFGIQSYYDQFKTLVKNMERQITIEFSLINDLTANGVFTIDSDSTDSLGLGNFDVTKRLKCMFKDKATNLVKHVPLLCAVDTTNKRISITYDVTTLASTLCPKLLKNTLYELIIKYDQTAIKYLSYPTTQGAFQLKIKFADTATKVYQVLPFNIYSNQISELITQTYIDHVSMNTNLYIQYKAQQSIGQTDYIDVLFPLKSVTNAGDLTTLNSADLNTGIQNGQSIGCLDKSNILGTYFKCYLYYGITDFQKPYTFVRMTNFTGISSGSTVSFVIQNIKNPSTTDLLMNYEIRITGGDQYEYTFANAAAYTIPAGSATATTAGTLTITPVVCFSKITYQYQVTINQPAQLNLESIVLINYQDELWGEDYTLFVANMDGTSARIDPMDQKNVFIVFPVDYASSASVKIQITDGLYQPSYVTTMTENVNAYFINYQTKQIIQSTKQSTSVTTTLANLATFGTVSGNSDLMLDPLTVMQIPITLLGPIKPNYYFIVTFPSDYALSGGYCKAIDDNTQAYYSVTCSDIDALNKQVVFNTKIKATIAFSVYLQVQTPSSAGSTSINVKFTYQPTFSPSPLTIQQATLPALTIVAYTKMRLAMPYIKTPQILLQDSEIGPITLTFKATSAITKQTHYATIDTNNFMTKTITQPTTSFRLQFACFWNNLAATFCKNGDTSANYNVITIYAPSDTNFATNDLVTIKIMIWRSEPIGTTDFTYQWHDVNDKVDPLIITDIVLTAATVAYKKNVVYQNYRFDETTTPTEKTFIAVHQGTINTETDLTVRFRLRRSLLSNLGTNWGQIILKIPTMDDFDLTQSQFPNGLGRFTKNGQEIDCFCITCLTISPPISSIDPLAPYFKCYIYQGSSHRVAPVEIWLNPLQNFVAQQIIEISFPKIKLPPTAYTYSKISLLAYEYDATKKQIKNHSEIVHFFTFTTIPDAFTTYTAITPPTFNINKAGAKSTVTAQVNNPYDDLLDYCHDRWVLSTDDVETIFEHPYNPESGLLYDGGGLYPYNYIDYTTATDHDVIIYKLAKWITFRPKLVQTKSATQTLNIQKFKNMPYMIPTGVNYKMTLFIDLGIRSYTEYSNFPTAQFYRLAYITSTTTLQKSLDPIPAPAETAAPQTYELKFLPYNKIPKNGKIVFTFPPLPSYDWVFTDQYCTVSQNLVDSGCDIIPASRILVIKDWLNDYDPNLDGYLSVKFDIVNPTNVQTQIPFLWTTYWDQNQNTWKIDDDTFFENTPVTPIIQGGNLIVTLWDRFQHPYIICGGRTGPIRLRFTLRDQNLVYPNDYIELWMWNTFIPSAVQKYIVCYFNDPNDFQLVNIKSHRCDWDGSSAKGGTLQIYIPEEIDIHVGDEWELVITTFGQIGQDGWIVKSPSDLYWVTFLAMQNGVNTLDKGWFEAQIPGCPFDNSGFDCQSIGWEASDPAGDPTWTILNFTAQTLYNNIPSGDPTLLQYSRLQFEFITQNELEQSWPMDLTNRMAATDERAQVACNGMYKQVGSNRPLQPKGNTYIECYNIKAENNIWNNTPSYILGQYFDAIAAQTMFHFQIADFRNGYVVGAFQHVKISVQVIQEDGTFYPQNEHYCWHLPPSLYAPPSPSSSQTSQWSIGRTQVAQTQQQSYFSDGTVQWFDTIVYDFNYPYTLPMKGFCQQRRYNGNYSDALNNAPCTPQHYNHWWVMNAAIEDPAVSWALRESGNFVNPPFVYKQNNLQNNPTIFNTINQQSPLRIYIWRGNKLISNQTFQQNSGNISPTTGQLFVVSQTTTNDNKKNTMVRHHIGIYLQTVTAAMKYIRLWAPNDYQNIQDCKINRGLVSPDPSDLDNKITCQITAPSAPLNLWLIEINNFQTYAGHGEDSWLIVDLNLTNPTTEKWTGNWWAKTYESSTNLSYVVDEAKTQDGQTWVGESVTQPNLFRVWRNTVSFENRRAQTDDYAEVHMRVFPRTAHPPTTTTSNTQLQIWLPLAYDLANGGDALCNVGNDYHTDLQSTSCSITSDRKITLNTDNTFGIKEQCQMVTVTTQNAIGGNNGIKLPSVPQDDTFQVFIDSTDSAGVVSREYNYNSAYAAPDPLSTAFGVSSTIKEANQYTIIQTYFIAPLDIPAGYDTSVAGSDPLSAPPIGTLRYKFNTKDLVNGGYPGFPLNLGQSSTNVLCQGFAAIKTNLQCTLIPSTQVSPDYPAIIEVRGFDYISAGDRVEIHFLNIKNGFSYQNQGNVSISSYKTKGDGTKIELIQDSTKWVPIYNPTYYGNVNYLVSTTCPANTDISVNPNLVGAYMQMNISNINVNCTSYASYTYAAGDQIILKFPPEFEFPAESNSAISALWATDIDTTIPPTAPTYQSTALTTIVYPLTREIYFTFVTNPPTPGTTCSSILKISQLRGPAYYFNTPYTIGLKVVRANFRRVDCSITSIPVPGISSPSTQSVTLSSYYAGDIFVDYDFKFSPSYKIPAGGIVNIAFPNRGLLNYSHVTSSQPPAVCNLFNSIYITSCVLSTTGIQVTVAQDIPAQQELEIKLTGVKNSDYAGQTLSSDYVLTMYHPNGQIVNQNGFQPFQFYAKKNVGVIYMKLSNTNSFQSVTASYTFVIQNSYQVPASGKIVLKMPKEWASVVSSSITLAKLSASWTSDALSYTYSIDSTSDINNYQLIINNQFTWPAGGSLTLLMLKLKNPSFESTKIFQALTYYDNVLLDQTDPLDSSLKFVFKPAVPSLTISGFTMEPSNAGEVSTYSLNMTTSNGAMTSGSTIQIQFPTDTYPSGLTRYDLSLGCQLTFNNGTKVTVPCSAANSKLTVNLSSDIPADTQFSLSIVGITNPNYDSTAIKGSLDVLTTDSNNNVLTYNSGAAEINPTAAPKTMKLVKLETSSTNLQVKAAYTLCIQTDQSIPLGAQVFIDFPQQFTFKSSSYPCYISTDHNNALLPYDNSTTSPLCSNSNSLRRIAVSNHTAAYTGSSTNPAQLCYIINNIENPSSPGPTDNFVVSIYDTTAKSITAQTFGTLSPNSTLSYSQQGLVITVESIDPLPRYLTTKPIKVTLERSVSHTVTLTPQSTEFKFIPPTLVFLPANGPEMYFKIQAIDDETAQVGLKQFSWLKVESATAKFSEMADSFFQYVDKPTANQLYMTINPRVFRVALGGTSLPMTLTLSQPAAQDLYCNFTTINPYQDSQLVFFPINAAGQVKFPAGTTSLQLQYTTKQQALSGQISFQIVDKYSSSYTIVDNIVNFEILETDDKIPEVVNYYAINVKRTSMYFRASIDESCTLYYYLALKGNPKPTMDQIKSQSKLTNVFTQFGQNQSYIAPVTSDYIYNDVYLDIQGLTESTDYSLYFYVTDLSGNNNTEVKQFDFKTAEKYQPAQFSITLSNDVDIDKLLSAFGLVTGLSSSSFQVISNPKKYTIDGDLDQDVKDILDAQTVTYTFQINPDATVGGISPYEYIRLIQQNLDLVQSEIPEVVDQNLFNTAWQYYEYPQEFKYTPIKMNVTEDAVYFNVSLRYTGNLYTLVLPASYPAPTSKQVSMGLNSTNYPVQDEWVYKVRFLYSNKTSTDDQKLYAVFNYTLLFDNSYYKAYFTAENNLVSNPDLMKDSEMQIIEFKTKREIVIIPKKYLESSLMTIIMMIVLLLG